MLKYISSNLSLIVGLLLSIGTLIGWVITYFNKIYRRKRNNEEFHETVKNHTKQISDMDMRHQEDYARLDKKLDGISLSLSNFINETKQDNQVIFRDKIYRIYKLTLDKGYIIEKDSKNYHYALERYLANNGNSYVCDEIMPRMDDFKVFNSDEDAERYFQNRK